MVDASNAWAVGSAGTILKWNGSTWTQQASNTTRNLYAVDFLNANVGVAVGSNIICRTTNGGATWTATPVSGVFLGVDISNFNSNYVLAVGSRSSYAFSNNGGGTWSTTGLSFPPGTYDMVDVEFTGATNVYVLTEVDQNITTPFNLSKEPLLKSTNLTNFAPVININLSASFVPTRMDMLTDSVGTIVGEGGVAYRIDTSTGSQTSQTTGTTNDLTDVYFADTNNGWIVGRPASSTTAPVYLRTTNAGSTWTSIPTGANTGVPITAVRGVSASSTVLIAGPGGLLARHASGGGGAFTFTANPIGFRHLGLKFLGSTLGISVGAEGSIMRNTGGSIWSVTSCSGASDLQEVVLTATNGVAVGNAGTVCLAASADWNSWTKVALPNAALDGMYLRDVALASGSTFVAVGDDLTNGVILRSTNNGSSWTRIIDVTAAYKGFTGIDFSGTTGIGVAVGLGGPRGAHDELRRVVVGAAEPQHHRRPLGRRVPRHDRLHPRARQPPPHLPIHRQRTDLDGAEQPPGVRHLEGPGLLVGRGGLRAG